MLSLLGALEATAFLRLRAFTARGCALIIKIYEIILSIRFLVSTGLVGLEILQNELWHHEIGNPVHE